MRRMPDLSWTPRRIGPTTEDSSIRGLHFLDVLSSVQAVKDYAEQLDKAERGAAAGALIGDATEKKTPEGTQ